MNNKSSDLKISIRTWKNASREPDKIKTAELRAEDYYEKNLPLLSAMLW